MYFSSEIKFIIFFHTFMVLFVTVRTTEMETAKKIAIVGAGIGGSSCAHFLSELFGKNRAVIHVYEANKVGGRLAVVNISGSLFESGGAIIHPRNSYMKELVHILDLKAVKRTSKELFGVYDGKEFKFVESKYQLITYMKFLLRYFWDPFRINSYLESLLDKFDSIYTSQNNYNCYETVRDLLASMDSRFPAHLNVTVFDGLEADANCHSNFLNEMVLAANMVNYGQTNSIHQFVGSVSLAGGMPGLWSVEGGNYQVAERLLQHSGAEFHNYAVNKIELLNNKYTLSTKQSAEEFDIVILATPIVQNVKQPIEFINFPKPVTVKGLYHRTVSTFVEGLINYKYFGYKQPEEIPGSIFSINSSNFFNSISLLRDSETHSVYKVFSKEVLTDEQLHLLFEVHHNVIVHDWTAYPSYSAENRRDSFILHKNLYYVNAIEWAASAMEMSVIGAKNVALLVYKNNEKNQYKRDQKLPRLVNIEL